MDKVEQDRHISSHDISKELNIDHKTILNYLEKSEYKKTWCLSATSHSEKFNGSNSLRIIAKTKRNFWNSSWAIKNADHVRQ